MATIYDVAERAGVSIATVSAVLNKSAYVSPELTLRVKAAVQELDYTINHLAHSLQTRQTKTIGMLIPVVGSPDPFFGLVVQGAEDVCRRKGYLLILGHTYNKVEEQSRYLAAFRSRLVDGVLLFQAAGEDEELKRMLAQKRPVVFVGRIPSGINVDVVATDIAAGTQMGVEHLMGKGHRRIGLITTSGSLSVESFRLAGWRKALRKRGLEVDDTLAISAELSEEGGRAATCRLLELPAPPTAIFADNLIVLTGVLRELRGRNLECPRNIELMSSDDAGWLDVFDPPISTVNQPSYQLGVEAAEMLLKRIRHPKRAVQSVSLKPQLHIRG